MSGEHEDRESEHSDHKPLVAEGVGGMVSDDASGPRASANPVATAELSDDNEPYPDRPSRIPARRSRPPPRPRLKDSKYPPPATSDSQDLPPPRAKVISSPDLPPARPRSAPPPGDDDDATLDSESPDVAQAQGSRGFPAIPSPPRPPTVLAGSDDIGSTESETPSRPPLPPAPAPPLRSRPPVPTAEASPASASDFSGARPPGVPPPPPTAVGAGSPAVGPRPTNLDPHAATGYGAPSTSGSALMPPSVTATAASKPPVLPAPPPRAPQERPAGPPPPPATPPTSNLGVPKVAAPPSVPKVIAPPPASASGSPKVIPPPGSGPSDRVAPNAPAQVEVTSPLPPVPKPPSRPDSAPPAAAEGSPRVIPPPAPKPETTSDATAGPGRTTSPSLRPPPRPPSPSVHDRPPPDSVADDVRQLRPPPPTSSPPSPGGAATSYPPPQGAPAPTRLDPIAVHAIRVINIAVEEDAVARDGLVPTPPPDHDDELEELDDFTDAEIEAPPDSLDEDEVQALAEDEHEVQIDVDEVPQTDSSQTAEVKLPPPPKRKPTPPKKKSPRAPTRKRRPWWEEVFSEDFSRATHHVSTRHIKREADFIDHSLGVAQGAVLLDLACGTGQHSIELASRGYSVVGYDLSVYQLAVAGEAAQERELKINFLQGDMREMAFQEMFDGIFCWNTSFGYFEEDKNIAVAERIFQALRPGGMFLIDVVNRDHVMQHQPSQVWFQGDACVCMDDMSVDFITSRLRVKRSIILDDGRTRECHYSIRLYTLHELGKLLHQVGFRVIEASGHPTTPGVYLGPNSPRVIILAQRP